MKQSAINKLAASAVIGAAYAVLSIAFAFIGYGPVQFRIAEVLCILPFFLPFSVWGLFAGCIVANLLSPYGPIDVIFGSLATLMAALLTMYIGRISNGGSAAKALACLPPVVCNGLIIGAMIAWSTAEEAFAVSFVWNAVTVALGEAAVMYAIGLPLMLYLPRLAFFKEIRLRLGK